MGPRFRWPGHVHVENTGIIQFVNVEPRVESAELTYLKATLGTRVCTYLWKRPCVMRLCVWWGRVLNYLKVSDCGFELRIIISGHDPVKKRRLFRRIVRIWVWNSMQIYAFATDAFGKIPVYSSAEGWNEDLWVFSVMEFKLKFRTFGKKFDKYLHWKISHGTLV